MDKDVNNMRIDHGNAVSLEWIARKVFKCDRSGYCGLIEADIFERSPFYAALICLTPHVHKYGENDEINAFFDKYYGVFDDLYDKQSAEATEKIIEDYVNDLDNLVNVLYKEKK